MFDAQLSAGKRVVVHCRAGVGRTGTLIAYTMMSKALNKGSENISEQSLIAKVMSTVAELRRQRGPDVVQTQNQLKLLIDTLRDDLVKAGRYIGGESKQHIKPSVLQHETGENNLVQTVAKISIPQPETQQKDRAARAISKEPGARAQQFFEKTQRPVNPHFHAHEVKKKSPDEIKAVNSVYQKVVLEGDLKARKVGAEASNRVMNPLKGPWFMKAMKLPSVSGHLGKIAQVVTTNLVNRVIEKTQGESTMRSRKLAENLGRLAGIAVTTASIATLAHFTFGWSLILDLPHVVLNMPRSTFEFAKAYNEVSQGPSNLRNEIPGHF